MAQHGPYLNLMQVAPLTNGAGWAVWDQSARGVEKVAKSPLGICDFESGHGCVELCEREQKQRCPSFPKPAESWRALH